MCTLLFFPHVIFILLLTIPVYKQICASQMPTQNTTPQSKR